MHATTDHIAFGAPGIEPRWTSSAQEGLGTAYVSLVRSAHDGVCFDRVEPAFQRYVVHPVGSRHEMWSVRDAIRRMPPGNILRLIWAADASVAVGEPK